MMENLGTSWKGSSSWQGGAGVIPISWINPTINRPIWATPKPATSWHSVLLTTVYHLKLLPWFQNFSLDHTTWLDFWETLYCHKGFVSSHIDPKTLHSFLLKFSVKLPPLKQLDFSWLQISLNATYVCIMFRRVSYHIRDTLNPRKATLFPWVSLLSLPS